MPMQGVHAVHAHAVHAHAVHAHVMYAHAVHCMYVRVRSDMPTVTIGPNRFTVTVTYQCSCFKFSITAKVGMTLETNGH